MDEIEKQTILREHQILVDDFFLKGKNDKSDFDLAAEAAMEKFKTDRLIVHAAWDIIANRLADTHQFVWVGDSSGFFALKSNNFFFLTNVEQILNNLILLYFEKINRRCSTYDILNVKQRIKAWTALPRSEFDKTEDDIHLLDSVYYLNGCKEYNFRTFIRIPWPKPMPLANCPKFEKFLDEFFDKAENPPHMKELIYEIFGYCLTKKIYLQKAFIFMGPPNGGKSTLINILVALVGKENCAKVSLQTLTERFGTSYIAGKLVCYYTEMDRSLVKNIGVFKDLVGDIELSYEAKNKPVEKIKNITKLIFTCNHLPRIPLNQLDLSFARRWILIECEHVFENPVRGWEKTIIEDPQEMQGILRKSLEALERLLQRGDFEQDPEEVLHLWRINTDLVYRFFIECCEKKGKEEQSELYNKFLEFLDSIGENAAINQATFTKHLKAFGVGVVTKKVVGSGGRKIAKRYYAPINYIGNVDDTGPAEDRKEEQAEAGKIDIITLGGEN